MKLLTYKHDEGTFAPGILDSTGEKIIPLSALGFGYRCMNQLIAGATPEELATMAAAASSPPQGCIPYSKVGRAAPIPQPRQDVICLGFNYLDHIKETAKLRSSASAGAPAHAVYFSKRVNLALGDGDEIKACPQLDEQLDYEAELAVIIGKDAKDVPAARAGEYIFGYTIMNDVSARALQTRHKQFYFGKSLDSFTPMGPWIVTADEFDSLPPQLRISSYINGELRQDSSTTNMLFNIPHIIAELSAGMTLLAGTIIATGTPAGVGMGFDPPRFLKAGDSVECVIEGIGRLRNTVV